MSLIKFPKHGFNPKKRRKLILKVPRDDWKPSAKRSIIIWEKIFQTQGHYKENHRF